METGKSSKHHPQFFACLTYELLGTAFVTLSYSMTGQNPFFRAVAYLLCYLWAVRVSGAHFNPATTFAVYLRNKDRSKENSLYLWVAMLVQVVGAFLGIVFVFLALKDYEVQLGGFAEFSPMQILDSVTP